MSEAHSYQVPVYRVALVKEGSINIQEQKHTDPGSIAPLLFKHFEVLDRECFAVVLLNSKNRIIGINTVSIGSLTQSIAEPREVFKPAILSNAAAVILAHNHPSGDPQPSQNDKAATVRLKQAGEVLGIKVLDHIITGDPGKYYSFTTAEGVKEAEESIEYRKRLLRKAQGRLVKGRATGEDIIRVAVYRLSQAQQMTKEKCLVEIEDIMKSLTPIMEMKRPPRGVKEDVEELISLINRLRVSCRQVKATSIFIEPNNK